MGVHPVRDLLCFGYVFVVFSVDLPGAGFKQEEQHIYLNYDSLPDSLKTLA